MSVTWLPTVKGHNDLLPPADSVVTLLDPEIPTR